MSRCEDEREEYGRGVRDGLVRLFVVWSWCLRVGWLKVLGLLWESTIWEYILKYQLMPIACWFELVLVRDDQDVYREH